MDDLIGKRVQIRIKNKKRYTSDLYNSIQDHEGIVSRNKSTQSVYDNAYLIKFSVQTTSDYAKTHGGQWGGLNADDPEINPMEWWIERKDFILLN